MVEAETMAEFVCEHVLASEFVQREPLLAIDTDFAKRDRVAVEGNVRLGRLVAVENRGGQWPKDDLYVSAAGVGMQAAGRSPLLHAGRDVPRKVRI